MNTQPMFLQELNPQQNLLVEQINRILLGTGLFVESGVSKDKNGNLTLYAVPKWIFKGMVSEENAENIYVYNVEIPLDQYVMSNHEIQAAAAQLSVKFLVSYCTDGREIIKEYHSSTLNELIRNKQSTQNSQENNEQETITESPKSGMAVQSGE